MPKQITLELPEWANWIAQDSDGGIEVYEKEPVLTQHTFFARQIVSESKMIIFGRQGNKNWSDSKINLNTHGAYIDADGILHRCELVPAMLRRQA